MAVDYKKQIGFTGQFLIEPKPKEPTKHQYDFDVAACFAFLQRYDLTRDVKLNLEQNHAILAGHSFQHEIALANAFGVFGSVAAGGTAGETAWIISTSLTAPLCRRRCAKAASVMLSTPPLTAIARDA